MGGAPLRIRMFGSVEVEVRGDALPKLRSRSELWLLALLALQQGRPGRRAWLAQSLWPFPDHATDQAAYNLRRALTNLRKALGPEAYRLQSVPPASLLLDLHGASVDAAAFAEAIARGDSGSLEAAVALYRGPLLLECTEPWAAAARADCEHQYLHALRQLAAQALSASDYDTANALLRRAVAVDPLCEPAQRALMETLSLSGDLPAALTTYQEFSRSLHRERNASPAPETTSLYHTMRAELRGRTKATKALAENPACPPPRPVHRLPIPLTPLIGRTGELREIKERVGQCRLLTLTGAGGVGKTRLAIQVAEEIAADFRDGVCFVDLAAVTDPAQVAQIAASALELPEEADHPILATLTRFLQSRQILLVLDNCEHLIEACAHLAETLLQGCRLLRIVATSRQSLGVAGEGIWRVASLSLPDPAHLATGAKTLSLVRDHSAIQLFAARASQVEPSFRLTEQNAGPVARICMQLEGIPLALELAAARVSALTVDQIADRLGDRFALLTQGPRTAVSRQQTLEATLKWSFDLLEPGDGALLRALSAFAGGWTLEMAEEVAHTGLTSVPYGRRVSSDQQPDVSPVWATNNQQLDALDVLSRLVDRSLVVRAGERGRARYRFLETVRQYCCEKWMSEGERREAAAHLVNEMLRLIEQAEPHLQGLDQARWFEEIENEHANILAALEWSAAEQAFAESGLKLAAALWRFWHRRGYLGLGRRCLARALEVTASQGSTRARADACVGAGMLAFFQGDTASARRWFEEGLAIGEALEDDSLRANALHSLGQMAWNQGDYPQARSLFSEVLAIQRQRLDRPQVAVTLNYLGVIASDIFECDNARTLFEESLQIGRELNDRRITANALHGLAHMAFNLSDFAGAHAYYSEELGIAQALKDREQTARALHRLGCVEQALKNYSAARRLFEQSLFAAEELAYRDLESAVLLNLGATACAQEDYVTARACLEQRLSLSEERGDKPGISYALDGFAALAALQQDSQRAVLLFAAAQSLREALGSGSPVNQLELPRLQSARSALGEAQFAKAWAIGSATSEEEAIALARSAADPGHPRRLHDPDDRDGLP